MLNLQSLDWDKVNGLLPVIVQHAVDGRVLMLGYMNQEALKKTVDEGLVTFFSRTKKRLWTKGETSGNVLSVVHLQADCDQDALLVLAHPQGPTCHRGTPTCFDRPDSRQPSLIWLAELQQIIQQRANANDQQSYTKKLLDQGIKRIAQKVGEEGVETALAATAGNREELAEESADLIYHLLVLLYAADLNLNDTLQVLASRHGAEMQHP